MMSDAIRAVILGIVEGITEFLPVSSTGHMLLVKRFFGLGEGAFWDSFIVLIQLGAILAIVVLYFAKLWRVAIGMFTNSDKRSAAEFSFFLAIPTMVGAFAYDFYKNRAEMTADHLGIIAIGFVVSFITAMIVVKTFLNYVTRHGFTFFAWWRVIVGTLGLIALAMGK